MILDLSQEACVTSHEPHLQSVVPSKGRGWPPLVGTCNFKNLSYPFSNPSVSPLLSISISDHATTIPLYLYQGISGPFNGEYTSDSTFSSRGLCRFIVAPTVRLLLH